MASKTRVTIDHDEIRKWAEQRRAKPAMVKGTGIVRLDFPGFSGEGKLEPIEWDQFFERFDESQLALIFQEKTARGQKSNFNKFVGRESVDLETGATKVAPPRRQRRSAGATKGRSARGGQRRAGQRAAKASTTRRAASAGARKGGGRKTKASPGRKAGRSSARTRKPGR
jgi:hypothetical protein